jgi:hypothetical protein
MYIYIYLLDRRHVHPFTLKFWPLTSPSEYKAKEGGVTLFDSHLNNVQIGLDGSERYVYICICIYIYVFMYMYIYLYIHICVYIFMYVYIHKYIYMNKYMYIYINVFIFIFIYIEGGWNDVITVVNV